MKGWEGWGVPGLGRLGSTPGQLFLPHLAVHRPQQRSMVNGVVPFFNPLSTPLKLLQSGGPHANCKHWLIDTTPTGGGGSIEPPKTGGGGGGSGNRLN